jgi:RsiW-degrading membrane proteinase PrsW (M82 family)
MQDNPAYQQFFTPEQALQIASKAHNWKATLQPLWNLQKQAFSAKVPILLTSIAGLVWLILAWQMIQTPGLLSFRTWAPVFAIVLGAASTFPVLFLDLYESEMWGLKHTGFFLSDCLFFIAGVGVREEVCKWIAFLPFVPIVLKRGNRLEAIIIAGCVGLGFAIEENVSYFHSSQSPEIAFGRFLTANFFHFAATGLIGVATCDAIVGFRKKWWKLPATLLVVALAHGFYDSFVGAPLKIFVAIGLSCFILLSLAFFREVARERGPATDQLFPGATLIVGLSTLVATVIACAAQQMGVDAALTAVAVSGVSLGLFVYMFFILFRDGLEEDAELPEPKFEPL